MYRLIAAVAGAVLMVAMFGGGGATATDAGKAGSETRPRVKHGRRSKKPNPRTFDFARYFGSGKQNDECGGGPAHISSISYFDFDKDGVEEAVIEAWSRCAGNGGPDIQGVYKLTDDGNVVELKIDRSRTFNGKCIQCGVGCWKSGSSLSVRNGHLVNEFSDGSGLPHPLTIFYTWNGKEFEISRVEKNPEIDARIQRSETARRKIRTVAKSDAAQLMTAFRIPTRASQPHGITAGPDGGIWFTENSGNKVGRLMPNQPDAVTEIHLPVPSEYPTLGSEPFAITVGSDGAIWFTEEAAHKVARIWPRDPYNIEEFNVRTGTAALYHIAAGPSGKVWVGTGNPAGCISIPQTQEFRLPGGEGRVPSLTVSPDGSLWFLREHVERKDPYHHHVSTWSIGHASTTNLEDVKEFALPGTPHDLMVGSDHALWVIGESRTAPCTEDIGRIWRIRLDDPNAITEIPLADSTPFGITLGPDGNIWFTESREKIGRISPATPECVTEFPVPASPEYPVGTFPSGITAGPDGNIWFTEGNGNQIVRLDVRAANQLSQDCRNGESADH
jgi:virginiamycin B lyase